MIYNIVQKERNKKNERGYTLLFAVLVSSLVLAIGISILTISKKEFLLATSARDSSLAFYAADGGMECAVYGDVGKFPDGSMRNTFDINKDNKENLGCDVTPAVIISDELFTKSINNVNYNAKRFKFDIKLGTDNTSCAFVKVEKYVLDGFIKTDIYSQGYNSGWLVSSCSSPSAKRVEREIHLKY